jgi:signal transduction histidine kinase
MSPRRAASAFTPVTALVAPRTWLATIYIFTGWPLALIAFILTAVLVPLGVGLLPLALAGLIVLVPILLFVGWFGRFERARLWATLGEYVPDPGGAPLAGGLVVRIRQLVRSRRRWRAVVYCLLALPVTVIGFCTIVAAWAVGLTGLTMPLWAHRLPAGGATIDGDPISSARWLVPIAIFGGIVLLSAPWIARGWANACAALVRSWLGPSEREELEERVETLTETRTRVVDAADAERRRIERDLHDGAQQRLVALAVDLGRARARLANDPSVAPETNALVAGAHEEAKQALAEIRDLVRGIHPAVLTDRGLDAALSALAARCPVPVTMDTAGLSGTRCSANVEAVAYFVVAEALTNVAKHSGAQSVLLEVRTVDDTRGRRLCVRIEDDGRGGANVDGSGLRGLADRVAALDGSFTVVSPPGGRTVLAADLPCGNISGNKENS